MLLPHSDDLDECASVQTAFMDRSIDLLEQRAEECDNRFCMNRRGYAFLTASEEGAARHLSSGATEGELPYSRGQTGLTAAQREEMPGSGLWRYSGAEAVRGFFSPLESFLSPQMGAHLLEEGKAGGVSWLSARVVGLRSEGGRLSRVLLDERGESKEVCCAAFVNCAGPMAAQVHRLSLEGNGTQAELPLRNEIHAKAVLRDRLRTIPQ
ncbi:MAG: hypothetical protein SGPRY_010352, partial [Prymnesium sp.]